MILKKQTDMVKASVNEDGQLQLFTDNNKVSGTASFAGSVDTIDVTSVGGAQQSVAVVDAALKFVDSQ